ncbi:hypothetical protein D3C74_49510 [compost metagenome]
MIILFIVLCFTGIAIQIAGALGQFFFHRKGNQKWFWISSVATIAGMTLFAAMYFTIVIGYGGMLER